VWGEGGEARTCTPATGLTSGISDSAKAAPAAVMANASGLRTPSNDSTQLSTWTDGEGDTVRDTVEETVKEPMRDTVGETAGQTVRETQ
jgi:hypothetical protein